MKRLTTAFIIAAALFGCATEDPDRTFTRPDGGDDDVLVTEDATTTTPDATAGERDGSAPAADAADGIDEDGGPDAHRSDTGSDEDVARDDTGDGFCRPNRDGLIEREEVTFQVGASARFMIAEDVTFDTAGTTEMDVRTWDLAQEFPGEYLDVLQLNDPAGQWFETTFPTATYFTPISASSDLLGVFEATDDALLLLGIVSPDDGFFRTEEEYDPPIPLLQFPLEEGKTWSVDSTVSGLYDGTVTVYDESYDFEVDADGVLQTAFGNFQVLRVRSTMDRQVGLYHTMIRSFAFVTECFGTVATVASEQNEEEVEFTDVAELKRIAP